MSVLVPIINLNSKPILFLLYHLTFYYMESKEMILWSLKKCLTFLILGDQDMDANVLLTRCVNAGIYLLDDITYCNELKRIAVDNTCIDCFKVLNNPLYYSSDVNSLPKPAP